MFAKEEFISGEVIQKACDVYCGESLGDFRFNPVISYDVSKHVIISSIVSAWDNPRYIFCYSHCLSAFQGRLHHLQNPFVLVSHNSDGHITDEYRQLLDHPLLIHWFAQNVCIRHEKLTQIPIGIANQMWPHGNRAAFHIASSMSDAAKEKLIPFLHNCNPATNRAARMECIRILASKGLSHTPAIPFTRYLQTLTTTKCVISPPGNGIDCHRLWEALYIGAIPIVLRSISTELFAEAGYPCIILDRWEDFNAEECLRKYSELAPRLAEVHTMLTAQALIARIRST